MYSKVKRQRRPVKRFMYEDEVPQSRSRKHVSTSDDSDSAKEEDGGEEEEEEEEEDQEDGETRRYSLRRNRRENRPFQLEAAGKYILIGRSTKVVEHFHFSEARMCDVTMAV